MRIYWPYSTTLSHSIGLTRSSRERSIPALQTLADYRQFTRNVSAPVLANITEFGKTPLFTVEELREAGVRLVLYPLSAFRAMSAAARSVYGAIRREGTQQAVVAQMQTRADLYDGLNYHAFEAKLDELFAKRKN